MSNRTILVTGGAGFIGVNTCSHFCKQGWEVVVFDNLSRKGTNLNLDWLQKNHDFRFIQGDVRDTDLVSTTLEEYQPEVAIHLAGQVAVTTSVQDPRTDFEVNALGTLNVLEGIRNQSPDTFFINASTNKVYGKMETEVIVERDGRYEYATRKNGISESQPLDFHSPYGCSKGAADQYTIDYSRIYGLNTVTFRQSCIYGPHQMGIEDQGWVAWFIIAVLSDQPITIYGDGKQVRDVLHVQDLIDCYQRAIDRREEINGQAFNIGGGANNKLSLLELLDLIVRISKKTPTTTEQEWRPGDQPVFVCDLDKVNKVLGWSPQTDVQTGVESLIQWFLKCGKLDGESW
ncbi:SDR family NAD(P)-dependent oxidoreductase [Pseudomonadota bacterium]